MTNDELEAKLEYYCKEYASLLKACEADTQARLKLVEECERLKDEINHWKVKAECYGDMVHGCHPIFVKLGVLEENQKGVGAIANAAQKLAAINIQLEAERDQWKRAANTLASDIKRLSVRDEMPQEAEVKEGRWQSVERELRDLQQRVAKLEQMQASPPMDCVANSTAFVTHDPESVHQAPDTEEVPNFIVTSLQQIVKSQGKQIADLLQRVEKLEMQRTGRCGIDYQPQVVTMPQEIEPLPASPESASREGGSAMNQREQFEQWHKHEYGFTFSECRDSSDRFEFTSRRQAWNAAWRVAQSANDAEVAELRENLAKCRAMFEFEAEEGIAHFVSMECDEKHEELRQAAKEACGL